MRSFLSSCVVLALFLIGGDIVSGQTPAQAPAQVTAIRAGRLLDPEGGRILTNQVIVVEGTRIRDVAGQSFLRFKRSLGSV